MLRQATGTNPGTNRITPDNREQTPGPAGATSTGASQPGATTDKTISRSRQKKALAVTSQSLAGGLSIIEYPYMFQLCKLNTKLCDLYITTIIACFQASVNPLYEWNVES
jgi:hypothetical protein